MMTTTTDYALMAGASYISNRPEINRFPVPSPRRAHSLAVRRMDKVSLKRQWTTVVHSTPGGADFFFLINPA